MAFAQSFYSQNPVLRINIMVVDDDLVFLNILSRMLEKSKYRDPSVMEITVIPAKDPMEALSTLKTRRNNIDLIITDYYMPGMNGVQLKRQINQEFGNLPVLVMSSDTNKEEESLTCGAMAFIPKPIKPIDLTNIYQLALTYKTNGKSILSTEQTHKDTNVSVPDQQINLLPEQCNVVKTTKRKCSSKSDSRSVNNTNGNCVNTDGSRKCRRKKPNGGRSDADESLSQPSKKPKIKWTDSLHDLFLQAIRHIGLDKAVPKKILEFMNVPYLTRENVASHLQKYRIFLKKVSDKGWDNILSGRGIDSMFRSTHIREPYVNHYTPSTSWYDSSLTNRSFYSKPGYGLGQSRLLSNIREPVRFNHMPYNYMNRSSTYEPHRLGSGPNLTLPIQSNLSLLNQPSHNEERRCFFEPSMLANNVGQTSPVLGFGQFGPSSISGTSFSNSMMSSYGSFTPNQPGPSHLSYGMQSFLNNENNSAYNPHPHANATTHPNLEIPRLENLDVYSDLNKTNELPYNISNFQFDHNKQQGEEASTEFELSTNFSTQLDHILSLEGDDDLAFVNINQGHSNGEISNTFDAPETNPPISNTNRNQNQEQDVDPDYSDWSFLDLEEFVYDDFMNSLSNDMA